MNDEEEGKIIRAWLCPGCNLVHLGIFDIAHRELARADMDSNTAKQLAAELQKLSLGH